MKALRSRQDKIRFVQARPVIIDAIVDPLELQLPAKLKPEEVEKFSQALKRGEPNREEIAANIQHLSQVREVI